MAMLLNRDAILRASDLRTIRHYVAEWQGEVIIRSLSGTERDAFEQSLLDTKAKSTRVNLRNARARLVALAVVDEEGKRLFSDFDVEALGLKSGAALDGIYEKAAALSGIGEHDLEEILGNSGSETPGDSTSG